MAKASSRPPLPGPPLTRTLARMGVLNPPAEAPNLPATLSTWVDWNRAVVLARALDNPAPAELASDSAASAEVLAAECEQARSELLVSLDALLGTLQESPSLPPQIVKQAAAFQRRLQIACGRLRGRLRDALLAGTPDQVALAELDAVMEQVLSPREFRLLDRLPTWAAAYCTPSLPADATSDITTPEPSWPEGLPAHLCADLRELLLAEFDLRFHPIQGLRAALGSQ